MKLLEKVHERHVASRRAEVLANRLAAALPAHCSLLDVGCGDGQVTWLIGRRRPDVAVCGVDVLVRDKTWVEVAPFDGEALPYDDDHFDAVMFIDVLHHADDPLALLREGARIARSTVLIKDHTCQGLLAGPTLRLMDWVGNRRHGVSLPYNYWRRGEWEEAFAAVGVEVEQWSGQLGLYPWPASLWFDRALHFIARLRVQPSAFAHV